MKTGLRNIAASAAIAVLMAGAGQAAAQNYPVDTVTLVTHSKAGGGTDVFLREMTKYLGKHMGTNFVVENVRGGVLGGIGPPAYPAVTSAVAEISPNSVTIGSTANSFTYDILATIGAGDSGVDRVTITVPATFGDPTVTGLTVGGAPVAYTDNTAGKATGIAATVSTRAKRAISI